MFLQLAQLIAASKAERQSGRAVRLPSLTCHPKLVDPPGPAELQAPLLRFALALGDIKKLMRKEEIGISLRELRMLAEMGTLITDPKDSGKWAKDVDDILLALSKDIEPLRPSAGNVHRALRRCRGWVKKAADYSGKNRTYRLTLSAKVEGAPRDIAEVEKRIRASFLSRAKELGSAIEADEEAEMTDILEMIRNEVSVGSWDLPREKGESGPTIQRLDAHLQVLMNYLEALPTSFGKYIPALEAVRERLAAGLEEFRSSRTGISIREILAELRGLLEQKALLNTTRSLLKKQLFRIEEHVAGLSQSPSEEPDVIIIYLPMSSVVGHANDDAREWAAWLSDSIEAYMEDRAKRLGWKVQKTTRTVVRVVNPADTF